MSSDLQQNREAIRDAMKRVGAILREERIPYALAGGLAVWARGGPEVDHDVDFLVPPDRVEQALAACSAAGLRIGRPPEGWLDKAWDGDVLVDFVFDPKGGSVESFIERAEMMEFYAVRMPVMRADDVLVTKLACITEASLHFEGPLHLARSLREQIDWTYVRERTEGSPFAAAFLVMLEGLGVIAPELRVVRASIDGRAG